MTTEPQRKCIFCGREDKNLLPTQSVKDAEENKPVTQYTCRICMEERLFINGKNIGTNI